jgi:aminobenzoyl-glutamate transport protein
MLPYTLVFGVAWTGLLVVWMLLGLPVGPDGPLHYALP